MIPGTNLRLLAPASGGYVVEGSGLFDGSSGYLSKTYSVTADSDQKFAMRMILKPSDFVSQDLWEAEGTSANNSVICYMTSTGQIRLTEFNANVATWDVLTTQLLRDLSAYYDIVQIIDTTQATAADRVKLYINGTLVTDFATASYPALNRNINWIDAADVFSIGQNEASGAGGYLDGYLANFTRIDGTTVSITDFGEVTSDGFWQINDASGLTFGTNGFLLEGTNVAAGTDSSVEGVVRTAIPTMTGYTSPSGEATASSVYGNTKFPWYTMDGLDDGNIWITAATNTGWIAYEFESAKTIVAYSLGVQGSGVSATRYPKNWQFQGWNGSAYVTLDTVTGETSWAANQERTYTVDSPASYIKYRLNITLNNGAGYVELGHFKMHESTVLGNNFIPSGTITATNDSPTDDADNGYGDYCTWNPLDNSPSYLNTYSEGNLKVVSKSGNAFMRSSPTMFVGSGKYYAEIKFTANAVNGSIGFLSSAAGHRSANNDGIGYENTGALAYGADGRTLVNGSVTATGGTTFTTNDVMMLALDMDNHDVYIGKNGTWLFSGVPDESTGAFYSDGILLSDEWGFACNGYGNPVGAYVTNFGASTFAYPQGATYNTEGFLSLSTANLPEPAIPDPDDHFHSQVVTHNGTSTASTCTFNLDTYEWLAIIKNTTGAVEGWYWMDSINGTSRYWDTSDANGLSQWPTDSNVMSVSGTTFTLLSTLGAKNYLVEFHKAGLAADTASNTEGSINTTATSVNLVSGFSLSQFTGTASNATIGHGLDSAPEFVINKTLGSAGDFGPAWHIGLTNAAYYLATDTTAAQASQGSIWNSTAPSSTLVSLGSHTSSNRNATNMSYAWHSVEGYSSFGSYVGNSNADGPFVNTGFSPVSFLNKSSSNAESWVLRDAAFDTDNPNVNILRPEQTSILYTHAGIYADNVSNGEKLRGNDNLHNGPSFTYIYCAWGGTPIQGNGKDTSQGRAR